VEEARARGGHPVLATPVVRRRFDEAGFFYDTHGEYPRVVREVAAEEGVPLLEMEDLSERGARLVAELAAQEMAPLGLPLVRYLRLEGLAP